MTLTAEQFNKIVTKDEFNELKEEFGEFRVQMKTVISMLEKSAKKDEKYEAEQASNMVAHDRFEKRITRTEKTLKLEPIYS